MDHVVDIMLDIFSAVMMVSVSVWLVLSMIDSTQLGKEVNRILTKKVDDYIFKDREQ